MLIEMRNVRQIKGDGYRRWFSDDYFDLYVWYEDEDLKNLLGFQLCYNKLKNEHAITWTKKAGFKHETVDDGESNASANKTPVLVSDGAFDSRTVSERFCSASGDIDKHVAHLVYKTLKKYPV